MAKANCDDCLNNKLDQLWGHLLEEHLADFLCNDCEKYLCSKCVGKHADHHTFSIKDKANKSKLDKFSKEMIDQLTSEGDLTLERFTQERTHICDVVDIGDGNDRGYSMMYIYILRNSKKWIIADQKNKSFKVFNINNNEMTTLVNLHHEPYGITEIPHTNPSQCLIAISFPDQNKIVFMDIHNESKSVISSINVHDVCHDVAYCNNKLITMCKGDSYGQRCSSIHVMQMTGEKINEIDLQNLPGTKLEWFRPGCMSVHSESETIYLSQSAMPSCVIGLSTDGKVLHSVTMTDLMPRLICVDRDQIVYVMGNKLPLYKFSSDLSQRHIVIEKGIIDEDVPFFYDVTSTCMACNADTFYVATMYGRVYIFRHE